jgi:hypothetical protein
MEVIMAALVKKTRSRFSHWCKEFVAKNKPPYRWYEYNGPGMA